MYDTKPTGTKIEPRSVIDVKNMITRTKKVAAREEKKKRGESDNKKRRGGEKKSMKGVEPAGGMEEGNKGGTDGRKGII